MILEHTGAFLGGLLDPESHPQKVPIIAQGQ